MRYVSQDEGVAFLAWRLKVSAFSVQEDAAARDLVQMLGQDLLQVNRAANYLQPRPGTGLAAYCPAYRAAAVQDKGQYLPDSAIDWIDLWDHRQ